MLPVPLSVAPLAAAPGACASCMPLPRVPRLARRPLLGLCQVRGRGRALASARACCSTRLPGNQRPLSNLVRNVRLAGMNLHVPVQDEGWIEVVANGLLWHGAQLALDATIVSAVTGSGNAQPWADTELGRAVDAAARRKRRRTYPELGQPGCSEVRAARCRSIARPP